MEGHAGFASVNQQLDDRVLAGTRKAGDGTDATSLAEKVQDFGTGLAVEYFHYFTLTLLCFLSSIK